MKRSGVRRPPVIILRCRGVALRSQKLKRALGCLCLVRLDNLEVNCRGKGKAVECLAGLAVTKGVSSAVPIAEAGEGEPVPANECSL